MRPNYPEDTAEGDDVEHKGKERRYCNIVIMIILCELKIVKQKMCESDEHVSSEWKDSQSDGAKGKWRGKRKTWYELYFAILFVDKQLGGKDFKRN